MKKKTKRQLKWGLGTTVGILLLAALIAFYTPKPVTSPAPSPLRVLVQEGTPPAPPVKPLATPEPPGVPLVPPSVPPQKEEPSVQAPMPEKPAAVAPPEEASAKGQIALIIDDMGLSPSLSARAIKLPAPVTLSFLPYASHLKAQTEQARAAGHPLMLHLPMQPWGKENPGPNALLISLSEAEIQRRLDLALRSFQGYDGVNNHMGSLFTSRADLLRPVMQTLYAHHLFFLDSRTGPSSVAEEVAHTEGVPTASRDIFIDDSSSPSAIRDQLVRLEKKAEHKGKAIAIGHPRPATLEALESWIPEAKKAGFDFVPVRTLVK